MNLPEAAILFALPHLSAESSELRLSYFPTFGDAQILRIDLDAIPVAIARLVPTEAGNDLRLRVNHGHIPSTEVEAIRRMAGSLHIPVPDLDHVPLAARDGSGYELYLGRYAHRLRCSWWDAQAGPEMESAAALAAVILEAANNVEWQDQTVLLCREEMERHDSMLNPSMQWMIEVGGDR